MLSATALVGEAFGGRLDTAYFTASVARPRAVELITHPVPTTLGAIILCGGMSRRMGRAKATLPFGPECMLQRVTRIVGEVVGATVIVAAPGQELPALPENVLVARDEIAGQGPLSGLSTGLAAFDDSVEFVYATATDVPFLEPRWIRSLVERIGDNDLAIPFIDGYHHPLAALYRRRTVLPAVKSLLTEGRLRPVFLMEQLKSLVLAESDLRDLDPTLGTICNLNTPDDYRDALRRAGFDDQENRYPAGGASGTIA
jgi:molybdenum cofactor guanylyltransferase